MAQAAAANTTCPAKRLFEEQRALIRAYHILEEIETKMEDRFDNPVWTQMQALWERIGAIEEGASWVRASSIEGAILQLVLIGRDVRDLRDFSLQGVDTAATSARIERNLYSALGALGANFSDELVDMYMPAYLDKIALTDTIVAGAVH